jgi:hypothetical protein
MLLCCMLRVVSLNIAQAAVCIAPVPVAVVTAVTDVCAHARYTIANATMTNDYDIITGLC